MNKEAVPGNRKPAESGGILPLIFTQRLGLDGIEAATRKNERLWEVWEPFLNNDEESVVRERLPAISIALSVEYSAEKELRVHSDLIVDWMEEPAAEADAHAPSQLLQSLGQPAWRSKLTRL